MTLRLQVLLIGCILLIIGFIIRMIRKKRMGFRYGLGWILIAICFLVLATFPDILKKVSLLIGIVSPMNTLFFCGFCFSVTIIFSLSITVSRQADRIKKLSQEISIIRKDIYDANRKLYQDIKKIENHNKNEVF